MTKAKLGKTKFKQALNQGGRANQAIRREVSSILDHRPGASELAVSMAKILLAVAENDEALQHLAEIGQDSILGTAGDVADGGRSPKE